MSPEDQNSAFEQRGSEVGLVGIEGEHLSAVIFVQDYVQLQFDGPIITAVTTPVVCSADRRVRFDEPGYRDGLCAFITRIVLEAVVRPGQELLIRFEAMRDTIVIPLDVSSYEGRPEAVVYADELKKQFGVW